MTALPAEWDPHDPESGFFKTVYPRKSREGRQLKNYGLILMKEMRKCSNTTSISIAGAEEKEIKLSVRI